MRPSLSVLIPARNEESGIAACVNSVLASRCVELEVIVLDDHSTDRTLAVVTAIAATDERVCVASAPPLPEGWCGKQAACSTLSELARHELLAFLDADVRLEPDALARMILFHEKSGAALVSGFPLQGTVTILERLLIPLIHWLLLSFLPLGLMRHFRWSAFGAGCGQWFLTTRSAYLASGGHRAVKSSLHDGITLPRAFRRAGYKTDLCDARNIATCRMYRSSRDVWYGLAKNAREGMAATGQILFWSLMLFLGQVLPLPMAVVCLFLRDWTSSLVFFAAFLPTICVRSLMVYRLENRNETNHALVHPLSILILLAIQWYSLYRALMSRPIGWKGRPHPERVNRSATSPTPHRIHGRSLAMMETKE